MHSGFLLHQNRAPLYKDGNEKIKKLLPHSVTKFKGVPSDFDHLMKAVGHARVVMIGEETHGTQEFYQQRADITKRLIKEKDFHFVALEGDWSDIYRMNRYVCGAKLDQTAREAMGDLIRFPKWMWRNEVVEEFLEWLKEYNNKSNSVHKVSIYGLDLYNMFRSAELVIQYLEKIDPKDAALARERYGNLSRYKNNELLYPQEIFLQLSPSREKEVVDMLTHMVVKGEEYLKIAGVFMNGDELFFAQQNAKVVKDAEAYYRNSFAGGVSTWNIRDKHMYETLAALLFFNEKKLDHESRAVVWAHNSHIGDSSATEYAKETKEWNLGNLVRENMGKHKSYNIGFTTYNGTVTAAPTWGSPAKTFDLTPAFKDSYEEVFHESLPTQWFLPLRSNSTQAHVNKELKDELMVSRTERMIGVQYVKNAERESHYVPVVLPNQFDSIIHIDTTSALKPLDSS